MTVEEHGDFISTGSLPSPAQVQDLLDTAFQKFAARAEGEVSRVYPALIRVNPELFGICLAGVRGNACSVGAAEHAFTIMAVSKPFVFALVCQEIGPEAVRKKIGVNATGHVFNSAAGIEHIASTRRGSMAFSTKRSESEPNQNGILRTYPAQGAPPQSTIPFLEIFVG